MRSEKDFSVRAGSNDLLSGGQIIPVFIKNLKNKVEKVDSFFFTGGSIVSTSKFR